MDWTGLYVCSLCSAASSAVVTDLPDPATLVPERSQQTQRDLEGVKAKLGLPHDADPMATLGAELLDSFAKDALVFATCPRCLKRNPEGAGQDATLRSRTRLIGTAASAAAALAVWLMPWFAFVVAAITILLSVMLVVSLVRAGTRPWGALALNGAVAAAICGAAWLYPRAVAIVPLILAVRFAIGDKKDDPRWARATATIRWTAPYR